MALNTLCFCLILETLLGESIPRGGSGQVPQPQETVLRTCCLEPCLEQSKSGGWGQGGGWRRRQRVEEGRKEEGPGARARPGGQRGLDTGTQGQAPGWSHEPDEPREDRVSSLSRLSAWGCTEVGKRGPPGLRTWGPADIGREEPVGGLPRVQAHQVELPEVGHVKHSSGPSAGQTLLPDLKSSRGGVLCGLRDLTPPPDPGPLAAVLLREPLLPSPPLARNTR